jgi:hypothetical protein
MKRWLMLLVAPAILLPAVGIIAFAVLAGGQEQEKATRPISSEFPEFVYSSPKSERGYQLAVDNQELFAKMPCYCGCGAMPEDPHRNLLDCFINDDGSFDPHASGCEVCDDIAIDAAQWQAEGKSPAEIRSLVDAKYQSFGPPTVS